jgi:hypothetical protein
MRNHITTTALFLILATAASADSKSFVEMDINGDGALDASEFSAAFGSEGAALFETLDSNQDGMVTTDEVTEASSGDIDDDELQEADLDGDGIVEGHEIQHVFGPRAQKALAKFDADGDGHVTLDEVRSSNNRRDREDRGPRSERDDRSSDKARENRDARDDRKEAREDRRDDKGREEKGRRDRSDKGERTKNDD